MKSDLPYQNIFVLRLKIVIRGFPVSFPVSADIEASFLRKPIRVNGNEINIIKLNRKILYL